MRRRRNARRSATGGRTKGRPRAFCCPPPTHGAGHEVLLITSRDTGRWVVPKGWPVAGKSAARSAAQEAFEEAGVEGTVSDDCIGVYSYGKVLGSKRILPCVVAVYPLRVTGLKEDFPEKGQRRLKWFRPQAAATKVAEPDLSAILAAFAPPPEADPAPGESR